MSTFHGKTPAAVLDELASSKGGLTSPEAARRLQRFGPNQLDPHREKPLYRRIFAQLGDPMIVLLLVAAALSLIVGGGRDWIDPAIILAIVVANSLISIFQENSAAEALAALQTLSAPHARVLRDGKMQSLPAAQLVPGDIVSLRAGDFVAADGRLLSANGLLADESAMTGESAAAEKSAEGLFPPDTPLADRRNMVLSGTGITGGSGVFVVTATGMQSEMGHIAGLLQNAPTAVTPLQVKLREVSRTLSFVCVAVCALLFGVGLLQKKDLLEMFLTAVSLAVAAIPEGLPAIVTIVLALGVSRLAKERAIVKTLPAVETLGCAGVICSDKTGTLTQNHMTVTQIWTAPGTDKKTALTIAALCNNETGTAGGNATETALLAAAHGFSLEKSVLELQFPRIFEVPFDSVRKRMTTLHKTPNGYRILVKGAPDVLFPLCKVLPVNAPVQNEEMARQALRVLGVAYRDCLVCPALTAAALEKDLIFGGLFGIIDPPRPEAKQAVSDCYRAGIRPVMITGDHKLTAIAIARELGIFKKGDYSLTGADLAFLPQEILTADIEKYTVFARVSPADKLRIVTAWQQRGYVVAMTGDGVNDAPALKTADIGCAMGKSGTEVAKGAADMILTDDNFSTIVSAVAQGRGIYANIKKSIHYLLSCNIGELLTISIATIFGFSVMPLVPVQLLWLNLVTDSLPALALGVEPVEDDVMDGVPRGKGESLFSKGFTLRLLWQGGMIGALTLTAYFLGLRDSPQAAGTMAFSALTLSQLFHAYDVRSEKRSIWHIGVLKNRAMNRAFLIGLALQLAVLLLPPLMAVFSVTAMTGTQWITVLALAITPLLV
ncbi:MAG: cation-translocating P-type ATPase, partial [Oscillospiraceae bacterium]